MSSGTGKACLANSRIIWRGYSLDQSLCFKGTQQPIGITGIKPKPGAQLSYFQTVFADLKQEPGFAKWTVAPQKIIVQHANSPGNCPVEAPNLLDVR
jgi:hypothetical protein